MHNLNAPSGKTRLLVSSLISGYLVFASQLSPGASLVRLCNALFFFFPPSPTGPFFSLIGCDGACCPPILCESNFSPSAPNTVVFLQGKFSRVRISRFPYDSYPPPVSKSFPPSVEGFSGWQGRFAPLYFFLSTTRPASTNFCGPPDPDCLFFPFSFRTAVGEALLLFSTRQPVFFLPFSPPSLLY